MRFDIASLVVATLTITATLVSGVPRSTVHSRSLVTEVGNIILAIENGLGITAAEDLLNVLTAGRLAAFEEKLGITFAEKMLGLYEGGADPGEIQAIGEAVVLYLDGWGLAQIDAFLVNVTNGGILTFENITGIADIRAALGIEQPGDGA